MTEIIPLSKETVQLELFEPKEIIRPDVNIGKWANVIFASPWARDLYETREYRFAAKIDGEELPASLTIRPAEGQKRPTTTTYRVFLGLLQIWEEVGKPENGEVVFSARQLAHVLGMRWCGRSTANSLHEQIEVLSNTALSWLFMFVRVKGGEPEDLYRNMRLIETNEYRQASQFRKSQKFTRLQRVVLNSELVRNMLEGNTKPINYRAFIGIKNDSSAKLYTFLDIVLAQKNDWARRAKALLYEDMQFAGERYQQRRLRLAKLKELVAELDGRELSNGKLALRIEKTADGEDYKLIARKTPRITRPARVPPKLANSPDEIPAIVDELIDGFRNFQRFYSKQIGIDGGSRGTFASMAKWYPREMLLQAQAIVRADLLDNIKGSPVKAFVATLHRMAHDRNMEWMKGCKPDCKHRPENRTPLFHASKHKG